jgi:hypothetical protein
MQIFNLSPDASATNNINIAEDVRSALTPITNSPFTVSATPASPTAATVLPANAARAVATIFNSGTEIAYLREGTSSIVSISSFSYLLLPNRLLTIGADFRYYGAIQAICSTGKTTILQVNESTIVIP